MLTIERKLVNKTVKIGDFIHDFDIRSEQLDSDGDRIKDIKRFNISVRAPQITGRAGSTQHFVQIEAVRETKPEPVWKITSAPNSYVLKCAGKHLVLVNRQHSKRAEWIFAENIVPGDELIIDTGSVIISDVGVTGDVEHLYDLQVQEAITDTHPDIDALRQGMVSDEFITHAYYTNGIVSHNSHALVHFGAHALMQGKNVNHYTFELSETSIGLRYDSNLTGIRSDEIFQHRDEVIRKEDEMKLGHLIIKGYPTGTATIQTLRAHIERCILQGHKPDVIMIDYADIMRSTRKYDAPRFELKLIYEELRNLAMTFDIPIWTASQANREAANADVVGLENMSEAYGKAMVADVVISLSRKADEKASGLGRLFVAKNRAGQDGIVYPIRINTATSHIAIIEGAEASDLDDVLRENDRSARAGLQSKWNKLRSSGFPMQKISES